MKMHQLIYLLTMAALAVASVHSSKILYIAPLNATSHFMWNTNLATELAARGHHVKYISVRDIKSPHPNMVVGYYEQPKEVLEYWFRLMGTMHAATATEKMYNFANAAVKECEYFFKNPVFSDLLDPSSKETFDLVMFEYSCSDCLLPLGRHFNAPVVLVSPILHNPHSLFRLSGVPLFHVHPHVADDQRTPLSSLWARLETLKIYLYDDYVYYWSMRPAMEELNRKNFGEDVLPVTKLAENVAVSLVNIPPFMNKIPLLPNVVPIGGLHVKEPKPLEPNLKKFLDEAKNGAVLMSFGTIVSTKYIADEMLQGMINAFSRIPQRVVWKWDGDDLRNFTFPKNIMRLSWTPQNDILGHPNTRLFISHCGGQSAIESAYHGVPVLGMPAFWDQRETANQLASVNAGIRIDQADITEANFFQAIKELTENDKYRKGAKHLQAAMQNQPVDPLNLAVFWIEYAIRYRTTPHLRPMLWDMPYPHVLITDIVIVTLIGISVFVGAILTLCFILRVLRRCFSSGPSKKNKKE